MRSNYLIGKRKTAKDRLWIVSELYYPEETSTGYYLTRLAEGLAGDFDVKVLSGQPNYSARGTIAAKKEIYNDVEIFRAAGTRLDKNIVFFRLINMVTLGTAVLFKSIFRFRSGDRVLVVTTPPLMPFIVAFASLVRGAAYTLLIHDNYPEILFAVNKLKRESWLAGLADFANRWLYKYASRIIVVGRDMEKLVERKASGLDIPIVSIPNWAELENVEPRARVSNRLLIELNIAEKFVFLYAGNMGHPNDLESIVDCAEALLSDQGVHFLFLGSGVKRPWLENQIKSRTLSNVTLLAPKPRSEQNVFLNACDVAFVSLVDKMLGVSMPSRTYNILAAGKPIIALTEPESELALVVREENVGWIVPPGDSQQLLAAIKDAYKNRSELSLMGQRARLAAETKYSLATALEKFKNNL